jgi:hypothetical protein
LPAIAPDLHYDVWHDMWVNSDLPVDRLVTVKRPSKSSADACGKDLMLAMAGRIESQLPLESGKNCRCNVEGDVQCLVKDLARVFSRFIHEGAPGNTPDS